MTELIGFTRYHYPDNPMTKSAYQRLIKRAADVANESMNQKEHNEHTLELLNSLLDSADQLERRVSLLEAALRELCLEVGGSAMKIREQIPNPMSEERRTP